MTTTTQPIPDLRSHLGCHGIPFTREIADVTCIFSCLSYCAVHANCRARAASGPSSGSGGPCPRRLKRASPYRAG